VSGSGADR